jgi:tetratricopeptide (TPR) repeat protein
MHLFQQALAVYQENSLPPGRTANALKNIAITYSRQGDHKNAIDYFRRALNIETREFGVEHINTANTLNNLGAAYGRVGKFDEAISRCRTALEITVRYNGPGHVDVATAHHNLGMMKLSQGFVKEAKKHFKESHQIFVASFGGQHPKSCRERKLVRTVGKLARSTKSGRLKTRIIR